MEFKTVLQILADPYRRRLLLRIQEENPEDVERIPRLLATTDEEFDRIVIKLHHAHLPMLAEAGTIDWDRDNDVIRRGPDFDELEPLLDFVRTHQDELPDGRIEQT